MPEYLAPGVYVEERSYRGKPIEGVSTSTAGFVGRARRGPEGRPTLVTSYTQFVREFGEPFSRPSGPGDHLGHAVRGFFENGGRRAYVVRVLGENAQPGVSATLDSGGVVGGTASGLATHGIVARLARNQSLTAGATVVALDSLRGIDVGPAGTPTELLFFTTDLATGTVSGAPRSATVDGYDALRGTVTITATPPLPALDWRTTFVLVDGAVPHGSSTPARAPTFRAVDRGEAGNGLSVRITPTDRPPIRIEGAPSARRAQPVLGTYAAGSPGLPDAASVLLEIDAANARLVREGDVLVLSNGASAEEVTIEALPDALVDVTIPPGTAFALADAITVELVEDRDGRDLRADPLLLGQVMGPLAPLTSPLVVPHAVAAAVGGGEILRFTQGATTAEVEVEPFTLGPVSATLVRTDAIDFRTSGATATLVRTHDRLLVVDATPFVPSMGLAYPSVAIDLGGSSIDRDLLYVDPAGALFLRSPLTAPEAAAWRTVASRRYAEGPVRVLSVASTSGLYEGASLEIDAGSRKEYRTVTGVDRTARTVALSADVGSASGFGSDAGASSALVRVLELQIDVLDGGTVVESFPGLSWNLDPAAESFARSYVERLNDPDAGSRLVRVDPPTSGSTAPADQPISADGQPIRLLGGSDGDPPEDRHLIGEDRGPGARTGIQALGEPEDISIVAVPGVTSEAVQAALITHCELLKYRVAVLDARQADADVSDILAHSHSYDSSYAAYYTPWLETLDLATGRTLEVPPSGHVAGIWARSDNTRGVHKAPANEVVRGITGLKYPFTRGEQEVLNPEGVNVLRAFERRGIRVWGARTLSSDPEWKYLNIRRLFVFLEHSLDRSTQWVVFESNNEALWDRVTSTIASFLFGVWATGAFTGTSADQAYFVRCDRTTMTQIDIDNGQLICLVGVAPSYPAEFVIFRIGQFTASSPNT